MSGQAHETLGGWSAMVACRSPCASAISDERAVEREQGGAEAGKAVRGRFGFGESSPVACEAVALGP